MADPLCRDCRDLQLEVKATRMIGKTPVCDEHMRQRLGMPATARGIAPAILGRAAMETAKETKVMATGKQLDEAVQSAIRRDAAAGMPLGEIAKKHKVSWPTAKRYAGGANGGKHAGRPKSAAKSADVGVAYEAALQELCDGIWAALPLGKKAALLNRLQEVS